MTEGDGSRLRDDGGRATEVAAGPSTYVPSAHVCQLPSSECHTFVGVSPYQHTFSSSLGCRNFVSLSLDVMGVPEHGVRDADLDAGLWWESVPIWYIEGFEFEGGKQRGTLKDG